MNYYYQVLTNASRKLLLRVAYAKFIARSDKSTEVNSHWEKFASVLHRLLPRSPQAVSGTGFQEKHASSRPKLRRNKSDRTSNHTMSEDGEWLQSTTSGFTLVLAASLVGLWISYTGCNFLPYLASASSIKVCPVSSITAVLTWSTSTITVGTSAAFRHGLREKEDSSATVVAFGDGNVDELLRYTHELLSVSKTNGSLETPLYFVWAALCRLGITTIQVRNKAPSLSRRPHVNFYEPELSSHSQELRVKPSATRSRRGHAIFRGLIKLVKTVAVVKLSRTNDPTFHTQKYMKLRMFVPWYRCTSACGRRSITVAGGQQRTIPRISTAIPVSWIDSLSQKLPSDKRF